MQLHPEIIEEAEKNLIWLWYPVDKIVNSDELQKIISEKAKDFKWKEFHSELERLKTEYTTARYNLVNKKWELYEIITNVYKYEKEYLAMKDLLS
jgi:predicted  nucleic acid-binding Zn-ribbon protein